MIIQILIQINFCSLSSQRVKIEHVNGILKETFGSLHELRIKITDTTSHKEAVEWITACLILYNIMRTMEYDLDLCEGGLDLDRDDGRN